MAVYGKYFEYNGRSSNEFNVLCGITEGDTTEIPMGLTRTVDKGEINKYRYRANHFGATYDDVLEFNLGIIKDPCKYNGNDMLFKRSEIREINAWLTSPKLPKLFHMVDHDKEYYDDYVDYYCTFTDVTSGAAGEIYSLTFQVTCDSPFGYSKEFTHKIESTNSQITSYEIENTSDEYEDYIYPLLKITPHSSGKIKIENTTDDGKYMEIDALANDIINIDCQKLKIYDETKKLITFDDLGVDDIDKIYWFRLCSGLNQIKITGDATVDISYRELRKVGAY